jgi:MYXO-CTERM domain-containing protein
VAVGQNSPAYQNLDSDGDGIPDSAEVGVALQPVDSDGDGVPNYLDTDSDGDGIPDAVEANAGGSVQSGTCPHSLCDAGAPLPVGCAANASDNDIISQLDAVSQGYCTNQGWDVNCVGVAVQNLGLKCGYDLVDTDKDGTPDYIDLDSDGDGIPDKVELAVDTDGDTVGNWRDLDSDNDAVLDAYEGAADVDQDGLGNYVDLDSDGDGIWDFVESLRTFCAIQNNNGLDTFGQTPGTVSGPYGSDGYKDLFEGPGCENEIGGNCDLCRGFLTNNVPPQFHVVQANGLDDFDQDGTPDIFDLDSDGDGITDAVEKGELSNFGAPIWPFIAANSDGTDPYSALFEPNYLDTDSDNDGILDADEKGANGAQPLDSDGDTVADYTDYDSDNDGLLDRDEGALDSDGDGLGNYVDVDSDGDGIYDVVEARRAICAVNKNNGFGEKLGTVGGPFGVNGFADAFECDGDGVVGCDVCKNEYTGNDFPDFNTDGTPDYLDLDSDSDGISDVIEGSPLVAAFGNPTLIFGANTDHDSPLDADYVDLDSDNDGIPDAVEGLVDTDGDGTPNFRDLDSDGDGAIDQLERGPDGTSPMDSDGDGTPNYLDLDSDNDCAPDATEAPLETINAALPNVNPSDNCTDPMLNFCDTTTGTCTKGCTTDADCGSASSGKVCGDAKVCVNGCRGTNGNGCPTNAVCTSKDDTVGTCDADDDSDGLSNSLEIALGTNPKNKDSDNDGIADGVETDGGNFVDTDQDGKMDALDSDSDNDGIADKFEKGAGADPVDTDKDGTPDYRDTDSDNDTVADSLEKNVDSDKDGQADYVDLDSDNDGVKDADEAAWATNRTYADSDHDGISDKDETAGGTNPVDTDKDGLLDALDPDSDGDSIPDAFEKGTGDKLADTDMDGTPDYLDLDSDADGIADKDEAGDNGAMPRDTDGDGTPDFLDLDSDGDTLADKDETDADYDGDGVANYRDLDSDNDCAPDQAEAAAGTQLDATKPGGSAGDNCPASAPTCDENKGQCVALPAGTPSTDEAKVAGAGLSCSTQPGSSSNGGTLVVLAGLVAAFAARRRKSA